MLSPTPRAQEQLFYDIPTARQMFPKLPIPLRPQPVTVHLCQLPSHTIAHWKTTVRPDYPKGSFKVCKVAYDVLTGEKLARLVSPCQGDLSNEETLLFQNTQAKMANIFAQCNQHQGIAVPVTACFKRGKRRFKGVIYMKFHNQADLLKAAKVSPISPEKTLRITETLLDVVRTLHEREIFHRDVKPENVLLDGDSVRLTDFDFSLVRPNGSRFEVCGSPFFLSPEIARCFLARTPISREYLGPSDVWALGILLFWLHFHTLPTALQECKNKAAIPDLFRRLNSFLNRPALNLIDCTPSSPCSPSSPYFGTLLPLLKRMLAFSPENRITAAEAYREFCALRLPTLNPGRLPVCEAAETEQTFVEEWDRV